MQQERQDNAIEILNPEQIASGSTVVLHSFPLNQMMDVEVDLMGATASAVTVPLPNPSPATSESSELSTGEDSDSQRSRRKRKSKALNEN